MLVAQVIVDVPTRVIDRPFDYRVPDRLSAVAVGSVVLVDFANRPVVGYVVGVGHVAEQGDEVAGKPKRALKDLTEILGEPLFTPQSVEIARWMAAEYLCPLSEALRVFLPPAGTPRVVRTRQSAAMSGDAVAPDSGWTLRRPDVGPVDDRWVTLGDKANEFTPRANAHTQRAVLDALTAGPVRVAELTADLGSVNAALKSLQAAGAVVIERKRRFREAHVREKSAPRHESLTEGQTAALKAIEETRHKSGGVVALDGVTGSGKTEVYLRALESVIEEGGTACVLVPEISLTPQTVGRFRSRFGDSIAVLHSRLSAGERFDQWDRVLRGEATIVVGARSALFAPLRDLKLIVIDEEHENSYKQSSAPRYHARDVAERLAAQWGATLVLGSASLSMETRERIRAGSWTGVEMPERVTGAQMPSVEVVDMAKEFSEGSRAMFSRALTQALLATRDAGDKAVLFLNRRGFASFVLCRDCGYVPNCDSCATSLTYHDVGARLMCHHCGSIKPLPTKCPRCGSVYLRQFGAGTQRVEAELESVVGDWPVVRMDADTTKGRGGHERLLAAFEALDSGVLLGTQMIAKGLDYPEVTLVGVISADLTLNIPDFRAGERTYQLLEQVAGRAGRGERPGKVIIQTYWPDHPAVMAAAAHDSKAFYEAERDMRRELGYPPFGRLANLLVWGRDAERVADYAKRLGASVGAALPEGWTMLGPSPSPLARLKGVWRWHVVIKAGSSENIAAAVGDMIGSMKPEDGISLVADVDPVDLL